MKVEELMSTPAITCCEEDTLDVAAKLMRTACCGAIPVLETTGSIVGMITDRDICMAAHDRECRLRDLRVAQIIDGNVYSVTSSDTVRYAEEVMRDNKVRRLPVVDDKEQVVGVLSLNDIAREGQRESSRRQRHRRINSEEVLRTLASISEPIFRDVRPIL